MSRPPAHILGLPAHTLRAVIALGITQIVAWGTSFYALGVLGEPIIAATGWSNTVVFGGFTIAVLASSAVSTPAGIALDRYGARRVMGAGFVLLAASLLALSRIDSVVGYFLVWPVIGVAMRLTLYDAAFAALVQIDPMNGRRAIAYLTLFGGFASTVGWPVGHLLNSAYGWQTTFALFALANLAINVPLALVGLPRGTASDGSTGEEPSPQATAANPGNGGENNSGAPATEATTLDGRARTIAMVLFSLVMSANAFIFGVGAIHLVSLIEGAGVALATAVGLASLKGVAQVGGRVWELIWGYRLPPLMLGRLAIALLPIGFALLLASGGGYEAALAFVLIFGTQNGLVTIVRGAVPLALFGPVGYGMVLGLLATPVLLFNALSPLVFSWMTEALGTAASTWILFAIALVGSLVMEVLIVWHRRTTAPADASDPAQEAGVRRS